MNIDELKSLVRFVRESPLLTALLEGRELEAEECVKRTWIPAHDIQITVFDHLRNMYLNPHLHRIKPEPRRMWIEYTSAGNTHCFFSVQPTEKQLKEASCYQHTIIEFIEKEAK